MVELGHEPRIWTISHEVIMARIAAQMELRSTDHRKPQDAGYDQGCDTAPDGNVLMQPILENMNTTPPEEVLKRITSLPNRQGKVLDIRRQIADGTYEVADRLDLVIDRILEALTA
jgi:anti-sigma28 factor (negative regulator of flagellin synthesis)